MVPLANAWRSGASSAAWSTADREEYANDPEVLLSADDAANQIKGDKGPEAWRPPNRDYWCEYTRRWIWIKSDWDLNVSANEKTARIGCTQPFSVVGIEALVGRVELPTIVEQGHNILTRPIAIAIQ